ADAEKFVTDTNDKYQNIDAAVLTVGGFAIGTASLTKTSDIAKQYQLNFETAYNIARPVFNNMRQNKTGLIFFIGSRPGIDAADGKGMIGYSLAKFLIFRLAELMNDEAKGTNIVTGLVVPSTIDTPTNRKAMPGADFNVRVKPEAIADVIYFYCTDEAAVLREPVIKVYNNS
ncbi:MAG: SDR family NAD(P)-dependent oxidoreductase, partial [Aquabacterium sp.]|nr:SDR family NAD(P)-dependent oxidoreductase [Ferruginibacter sp.]